MCSELEKCVLKECLFSFGTIWPLYRLPLLVDTGTSPSHILFTNAWMFLIVENKIICEFNYHKIFNVIGVQVVHKESGLELMVLSGLSGESSDACTLGSSCKEIPKTTSY